MRTTLLLPNVRRSARFVPVLLAGIVSLIWASSFFLIKDGLRWTNPLAFAGWRYTLGGLALAGFSALRRPGYAPTREWWLYGAVCGLLGYTAGQGLLYTAQSLVSPMLAAFMYSLTPVFVLGTVTLWERALPSAKRMVGIAAVVAGAAVYVPLHAFAQSSGNGAGLLLLSDAATAGFLLLARRALDRGVPPLWLASTSLIGGGLQLFAICFALHADPTLHRESMPSMVALAMVNTAFAYALYTKAQAVLPAFEMSLVSAVIPLEAAAFAALWLGDHLPALRAIGLVTAFIGIALCGSSSGSALRRNR
jgi:drug/metabolite transporter (DMT)-like permease